MKKTLLLSFFALVLMIQAGISQTYIWGGPGDKNSEFNGGLNDWTVVAVSPNDKALWIWEADGKPDRGAYSGKANQAAIKSPSVANGAMVFDSDFYDNAGTPGNFGKGISPGPQVGELISPTFSCAGRTSVWLKFNQYYRNYQTTPKFAVSIDGGANWKESIILNSNIALNASTTTDSEILYDISSLAAGHANVKIKFIWDGNYYFWVIDDVYVIETPAADPKVLGTWYPSMHYGIPQYMADRDSMYFVMDIVNGGGGEVSNVEAKVTLYNSDLEKLYFTDSKNFDLGSNDTSRVYFDSYLLPADCDTGLYAVDYEIIGSDFATASGKLHRHYFRIYPEVFDRMEGDWEVNKTRCRNTDDTYNTGFWGGATARYNVSYYKLGDWVDNPNLIKYKAVSTLFAVSLDGSDIINYAASVTLHEIDDEINSLLTDFDFSDGLGVDGKESTQLTYVGYSFDNVENVADGAKVTVNLYNLDDEVGVELKPNKKYFIATYWPGDRTYYQGADNVNASGHSRYYYRWDNDIVDGDTIPGQYVSFMYSPTDQRFYIPTGTGSITLNYAIDMNLEVWRNTVLTEEEMLPESTFALHQNPVRNALGIDVNFANTVDHATIIIHDLNGAVLKMKNLYDVKETNEVFQVGNYPAGEYLITIYTKEKLLTKKFIVAK